MSTALIFPGQGSQYIGMLGDYVQHPIVLALMRQASDVLGYDMAALIESGPEEKLNQTELTQPALLATSIALWLLYRDGHPLPAVVAGHSLGEYSALVAADALDFEDALSLVAARGRFMQEAVPPGVGAMAAILGLDDASIVKACAMAAQNEVVSAVNFNAPGQVVIAGNKAAVERAIEAAKSLGAKRALPLPVSVPSHCALMKPAAKQLEQMLTKIVVKKPRIPVINNVDVVAQTDPDRIKDALLRQLYSPVRWVEVVQAMVNLGAEQFIECGPGKVLCGLNKRITSEMPVDNVQASLFVN